MARAFDWRGVELSKVISFNNNLEVFKKFKSWIDKIANKIDIKDPKNIAKLVIDGQYLETYISENVYAELRFKLSKEMISIKNKVQRWLKIYTTVLKSFTGKRSTLILKELPLLSEIKTKTAEEINSIWRNEKVRTVGMKRAEKLL